MGALRQYTEDDLRRHEEELHLSVFTHLDAVDLGLMLLAMARDRALPVGLAVSLAHQQVFSAGLPGSSGDHMEWLQRKTAATNKFDQCSLRLELRVNADPTFATERGLNTEAFALVGGAFPIRINGASVGAATVAGLHSTEDHALVVEALRRFKSKASA
jgi:uncharacterized protein (UPF0303 family)